MRLLLEVQERKLNDLLEKIKVVSDDEIKAHLSRYFCIKISGYLENVIKILIVHYSDGSSPKEVSNYLQQDVKNITNLSGEKIDRILTKFSKDWSSKFAERVSEQQIESLNSIISNRNNIAHGQQDNISLSVMIQYYEDLKGIVIILKDIIKK